MSNYDNQATRYSTSVDAQSAIDQGLRAYMLRVYNYMALGLVLTGVTAYVVANTSVGALFYTQTTTGFGMTVLGWIAFIAPIGLVFLLSFGIQRMSAGTAQLVFWIYAGLMGISLATIFFAYTMTSITQVFFISAATFGAMSLYGYTTKADLSRFGSFLFMGLIGIVLASIVNIFIGSTALGFAISIIGVLVFVGLTAYDTQKIKEMYDVNDDGTVSGRKAIMGALSLYLDFINLFLMMLRLFGSQRD
ncbi:MAG: Bax inhibitor-1/YccA family protein [Bauldia sp.]